ncbi:hypothetical protein T492DRAFT_595559, partial [Pavlovales sp. CCMP2436]
ANTAWAFATLGTPAPQLFEAIARESEQCLGSFKPQGLVNTAWAASSASAASSRKLFEAIARESEQRISSFNPQELANTAWAFATLCAPLLLLLFEAIARESEQHIGSFEPQNLANTAWAFAIVGTADRGALVKVHSARAAEMGLAAFIGEQWRQLHQYFLGVELEACLPAELLAPIGLRDACRQAMADEKPARSSKLHEDVSNVLTRIGIAHANELCVATRAREALRAAIASHVGIVLEVDCPSHYDDERRLLSALEMIRRHLWLPGWAVLGVPYWEWYALKGHAQKAAYLAISLRMLQDQSPTILATCSNWKRCLLAINIATNLAFISNV